jgi:orotidine-5'-phosphate decarboxylase
LSDGFADRLAALVEERRSQVCLGLDPAPAPAAEVVSRCERLIEATAGVCVATKLQLACFERLGASGWEALEAVVAAARAHGLLVIADGKRGDVPVTAAVYAEALFGPGAGTDDVVKPLGADAATLNPLLGRDAVDPLIAAAAASGAGVFLLVRTSNPGAADLFDLETADGPLFEQIARLVDGESERLAGERGLSGVGAVVGATEPRHLARLRELMPRSIFLIPGVGAQGGSAAELGPALGAHPASVLVPVSRSIADAADPAQAAESLRAELWRSSQ